MIWKTRRRHIDLSHRAMVMGILNVTPDSFSDGGRHAGVRSALAHARQMIAEGAEIIDVGGESTRPGAHAVSSEEETARTQPVIAAIRSVWDGLISIDTSKASVAQAALAAGADIVNDVSGLRADSAMLAVCAASGCGVVVMHMQGEPGTMHIHPQYADVVAEVSGFFEKRMSALIAAGICEHALCFDPGIGFGKTPAHNLALLRAIGNISPHGRPLLLGVSRKSFIGSILASENAKEHAVLDSCQRDYATVAITSWARKQGTMIHRVHAVKSNHEALRMTEAILGTPTIH